MQIHIETGDWKTLQHPCERIRLMVFVAEQGVPKAEEIDGSRSCEYSLRCMGRTSHDARLCTYDARRQNRTFGCA